MKFSSWLTELEYTHLQGDLDVEVTEVIYDSRKAASGAVFVCMKGTRVDSHDFIPQAVKAGISALVVEADCAVPDGVSAVRVKSARKALALLSAARFGYPARNMITIGVTGTKGKTTVTHMIKSILEHCGKKAGLVGTNGVIIGEKRYPTVNTTPESYELHEYFYKMVQEGCQYMIMEVSSQGTKMHRTDGIWFDYAVFNNISPDHIGPDEHADFDEYLRCKAMLFDQCRVGLFNRDDAHCEEMLSLCSCRERYYFSLDQEADFTARHVHYVAENQFIGLEFEVRGRSETSLRVGIPGRFNVYNALAAISVCSFFDLPGDCSAHALEHIHVNGRMEIAYASPDCTVIIDYAHNAVSMESLLKTLRDYQPKRLVCVFGCGGNRSKDRRYEMGRIGGELADFCIITADNSRYEKVEDIMEDIRGSMEKANGAYVMIPDRRKAIEFSITQSQPGDMVAIIGKGHEDYQEIEGVRYPFLDRAVVDEVVSQWKK